EREARARAEQAMARCAAGAALAERVRQVGGRVAEKLAASVTAAATARAAAESDRSAAEQAATAARSSAAALQSEWDSLADSVHSTEVLRAQQRLRMEQLAETASTEYAIGPDDLLAEFGPDVPVPPPAAEMAEYEAA